MSSVAPALLELLEKWTLKTPNKIAMSFLNDSADVIKSTSLTYLEISVKSSQLAAHLTSGQTPLTVGNRYICSTPVLLLTIKCVQLVNLISDEIGTHK